MKLEKLIATVKTLEKAAELWLTEKSFHELVKEAEKLMVLEVGHLTLRYESIEIKISLNEEMTSLAGPKYRIKIQSIWEIEKYTHFKKRELFNSPDNSSRNFIL